MSLWWFDQLADLVPHHVVSTDVPAAVRRPGGDLRAAGDVPGGVRRPRLPRRLRAARLPRHRRGVRHRRCPPGWWTAAGCPEPIFTPATKAAIGEHDENVSYEAVVAHGRRRAPPQSCAS